MKQGFFDKVILFVLFNNIRAEVCEKTTYTNIECLGPCNVDVPAWQAIYWCDECCQMNSTWYCVDDVADHKCEATAQTNPTVPSTKRPTGSVTTTTTHRPTRGVSSTTQRYFTYKPFTAYPKHTTYDYIDQYFPNTSKPSKHVVVSIFAAFGAVIVLVVIITFIVMKQSKRRDQQRRDALFNAANEQISRNSGQLRGNPVYIVGERETETVVNWTHNNLDDSSANNENNAQGFMQNSQPPPYSECIASHQSSKQLSAPTDSAYHPPNYSITSPPL